MSKVVNAWKLSFLIESLTFSNIGPRFLFNKPFKKCAKSQNKPTMCQQSKAKKCKSILLT
jgi:hypothetical protein